MARSPRLRYQSRFTTRSASIASVPSRGASELQEVLLVRRELDGTLRRQNGLGTSHSMRACIHARPGFSFRSDGASGPSRVRAVRGELSRTDWTFGHSFAVGHGSSPRLSPRLFRCGMIAPR